MKHKPTAEQKRLFTFVEKRDENILIKALAGSGKTSSIIEAATLLPKEKSKLFLAFNKHIQEELKEKLPQDMKCFTTYGIGNASIRRKYGDDIKFNEFKIDNIIKSKSKNWELDVEFDNNDELISTYLSNIKKLVDLCRLTLTLKPDYVPYIAERFDIYLKSKKDIKRVLKILDEATNDRTQYDYTDMVYLPSIDSSLWMYQYDYVFVDEIQDLNRCQIKILEKCIKRDRKTGKIKGRLISVGDAFQNIYGFNGSGDNSFEWFEKFENTAILPLTTSFRCSKNVIRKAQEIVPEIKALDSAPDGMVREGNVLEEARGGDFVLCRTTMPLVQLFFQFLSQNKKAIIKGSDIGVHLIELVGKVKTIPELHSHWSKELLLFRNRLVSEGILNPNEHTGYTTLEDKVNTLIFLSTYANDIEDLKLKIKAIFTDDIDGICLSTVHKVKGLEADRVFIVRPDLLPMTTVTKGWQVQQEKNLEYVAITRAKLELIYDFKWTNDEI